MLFRKGMFSVVGGTSAETVRPWSLAEGRMSHALAAATGKARSPSVVRRIRWAIIAGMSRTIVNLWSIRDIGRESKLFGRWQQRCGLSLTLLQQSVSEVWPLSHRRHIFITHQESPIAAVDKRHHAPCFGNQLPASFLRPRLNHSPYDLFNLFFTRGYHFPASFLRPHLNHSSRDLFRLFHAWLPFSVYSPPLERSTITPSLFPPCLKPTRFAYPSYHKLLTN